MTVVACAKADAIAAVEAAAFTTADDPPRRIVHSTTGGSLMLGCDWDVEAVVAHIEAAAEVPPGAENPPIGWVTGGMLVGHELGVIANGRLMFFDVKAPPGTFDPPEPMVRLPELTITEARLLARMLELAPVEAALSAPGMPPGVADELQATAASLRTAVLEAITTAERTTS